MTLVVTGAAGFIGSNFVQHSLEHYAEEISKILVIDKLNYAGNLKNIEIQTEKAVALGVDYEFVNLDLANWDDLEKLGKNYTDLKNLKILHFAAESHVDRSLNSPRNFLKSNVVGTFNLLELMRLYLDQARFHLVSTDEVHGEVQSGEKFSEETNYAPRNPYSASKAAADHFAMSYFHTYGLNITISSCTNNYGPFCFPEKLIPLAITRAIRDLSIPVYGDGLQIRDWIFVEDHVRGLWKILKSAEMGTVYKLGGDSETTNLEIVQSILKKLSKPSSLIQHVGDRQGHDRHYAIDFSKAKRELGFTPHFSLDRGLEDTVEWYVQNEEWWQQLVDRADEVAENYLNSKE